MIGWGLTLRALILILLPISAALGASPEYRAGTAVADITPESPIRLSGYGSRTKPSEGVLTRLHAKALAISRGKQERVVIVTTDLIGLPRSITDVVAARVLQQYGLERSALWFNSSHTHTGPYIKGNLPLLFQLSAEDQTAVDAYAGRLQAALTGVIGEALSAMQPASLGIAHGEANFAINRREAAGGTMKIGLNPAGPVDFDVPVLRVTGANGKTLAILFGYACHNTTLTGQFNVISGDYAGFAQESIEKASQAANPGAVAMFVMLCGADQNPNPRGTVELARRHGDALAAAVNRVLAGGMAPVKGRIRTAFRIVELEFRPDDRAGFEAIVNDPNPQVRTSARGLHAEAMLRAMDRGQTVRRYPYPVQAISFGGDFTIVTLGGEVLVDYALRLKRESPGRKLFFVAGYSNDVMAYIPTLRASKEGGYEVLDFMYYYGLPAPWADDTEERIIAAARDVLNRVR